MLQQNLRPLYIVYIATINS